MMHNGLLKQALAGIILLSISATADAARGRFHYVPADSCGTAALKPSGPCGTVGERISVLGTRPDCCPPPPTCLHTYRHPCTGQTVVVPLALPDDTPVIYHRANRIIYNYGSYAVEVHFLPDGSVDVVYNSGLFRAL